MSSPLNRMRSESLNVTMGKGGALRPWLTRFRMFSWPMSVADGASTVSP